MKSVLTLGAVVLCGLLSAQAETQNSTKTSTSARVLFADDFKAAKDSSWKFTNYQKRLKIERKQFEGKQALVITNGIGKAMDTAFDLMVQPLPVSEPQQYSITFSSSASFATEGCVGSKMRSQNRIEFLDANKKLIKAEKFRYSSAKKGYKENVITGTAPTGTKYISMAFGSDVPDIRPNHYIAIADLKIRVVDAVTSSWDAAAGTKEVLSDDFSKDSGAWEAFKNYQNRLKIERKQIEGKPALIISNDSGKKMDTAFAVATKKMDINGAAQYRISFELYANYWTADYGKAKRGSRSYVGFYDISGKLIATHPVIFNGSSKTFKPYTYTGKIPAQAASFVLQFGGDSPDVMPDKFIAITNVKIQLTGTR